MMTDSSDARVVMIGSVTGNDNTVGGGGVYPIADLKAGGTETSSCSRIQAVKLSAFLVM